MTNAHRRQLSPGCEQQNTVALDGLVRRASWFVELVHATSEYDILGSVHTPATCTHTLACTCTCTHTPCNNEWLSGWFGLFCWRRKGTQKASFFLFLHGASQQPTALFKRHRLDVPGFLRSKRRRRRDDTKEECQTRAWHFPSSMPVEACWNPFQTTTWDCRTILLYPSLSHDLSPRIKRGGWMICHMHNRCYFTILSYHQRSK